MSRITRRRALGVAASAAAGLAAGRALTAPAQAVAAPAHLGAGPETFDEIVMGRRIQGGPSHGDGHHGGHGAEHGSGYSVRIDGEELHVMRNADGTWISVINHYEPLATPRAVARAAVRELQGAPLVPVATA
ncbi:tyrosinase cofactor [Streptomyces sp. CB03238]|uniref:apotyrosinase chaperone MelC1 n=1 Tax=Streptomyces sp. CB03238 TaxID=1907777 RepID=UPI000A0F8920|nr:tyrosinase cofactor [Streptomyces sp. CB03238]ORT57288.1 tyrosinase [Streptomyces sp. CB03238]